MTFMHRRFRSYKGRPAWWWRAYANRHERRSHGTAPVNTVALEGDEAGNFLALEGDMAPGDLLVEGDMAT